MKSVITLYSLCPLGFLERKKEICIVTRKKIGYDGFLSKRKFSLGIVIGNVNLTRCCRPSTTSLHCHSRTALDWLWPKYLPGKHPQSWKLEIWLVCLFSEKNFFLELGFKRQACFLATKRGGARHSTIHGHGSIVWHEDDSPFPSIPPSSLWRTLSVAFTY